MFMAVIRSVVMALAAMPILLVIASAFDLDGRDSAMLVLITCVVIYAGYLAPAIEQITREREVLAQRARMRVVDPPKDV